ncbi:MAG TPA: hypothetical protein VMU32_03840 [Solirubrobacteraceae bacterium]|nr:hypothetical protein [Solirubrobacteraceae bacterium]
MLTGVIIGGIVAGVGLLRLYPKRHEPEPPNSRWKLPFLIVMVAICVVFTIVGQWPILWAALAVVIFVQIGFVLIGRNPWWMQTSLDRRREHSTSAR